MSEVSRFRKKMMYYFLFLFLLFMMCMLIYPRGSYSGGVDTLDYQVASNTINYYGNIKYLMHPISIWGLYPFSLPSGVPIFLSVATQLTGMHVIQNPIVLNYIFGLFIILTSIALSLKIKKDFLFVLGSSFVISLSPRFISYLTGIFEARGLIAYLFPFWFLLIAMFYKNEDPKKYLALSFFVFFFISIIHLNFLFFIPIFICMIIIKIEEISNKISVIKKRIQKVKFRNYRIYSVMQHRLTKGIFWFLLSLTFLFLLLYMGERGLIPTGRYDPSRFEEGGFISGWGTFSALVNIIISMSGGAGAGFFILGVIGFFVAFSVPRKTTLDSLFLFSFIFSIPLTATSVYFRPFFVIYAAFFAGYGLLWINKRLVSKKKVLLILLVIVLIISTSLFTPYMSSRWIKGMSSEDTDFYTNEHVFNNGIYLRYNHNEEHRFAEHRRFRDSKRLEIISGAPRYRNPFSINEMIHIVEMETWSIQKTGMLHQPYISSPGEELLYPRFLAGNFDRMMNLAVEHNITIVYTNPDIDYLNIRLFQMSERRYKIYENDEGIFWRF